MHRLRHPVLIAALALASYIAVPVPVAAVTAVKGTGFHSASAEAHGSKSRQQHGGGPETLETLKDRAYHHLAEFGQEMLATQHSTRCKIVGMGSAHGEHSLCAELKPHGTCTFYSYGISHDYSFDTVMADEWGCKGVALDPSVSILKLHPKSPSTTSPREDQTRTKTRSGTS